MKNYPDGKLNDTDEGALDIATRIEDGCVILDFGKDLTWIGLDKESLRAFIDGLEAQYKRL